MEVGVIGISYKQGDVDIRGEVAFTNSLKRESGKRLEQAGVQEFMILSTCNRSEIYFVSHDFDRDVKTLKKLFESISDEMILPYLYVKKGEMALSHLYQVAIGLDSMIIGEDEILAQLKKAYVFSIEQKTSKKYLNKIVREAITFSKKMRSVYNLSQNQLSIGAICVRFLADRFGDLSNMKILLVGTGQLGQLVLTYLNQIAVDQIFLTNRTPHKQESDFQINRRVTLIDYQERYDYINEVDIVISATASPHTIISKEKLKPLTKAVLLVDLAVPRDIDKSVASLPLAQLITIDTFEQVSASHIAIRQENAIQIERLIHEEVKQLQTWLIKTKIDYLIKDIHQYQNKILEEKKKQINKLNLSSKQEKAVYEMLHHATWAMVKAPLKKMKQIQDEEDIELPPDFFDDLFDYEGGA